MAVAVPWRPTSACPKGHSLVAKTVVGSWFGACKTCNSCCESLTSGTLRHSCKDCNYHLCTKCSDARAEEMLGEEITLTIFRAAQQGLLPGLGVDEDAFQVAVQRGATVAALKARVAELYGLPPMLQMLRRDADSELLADTEPLACDDGDVVYLGAGRAPAGIGAGGPAGDLLGGLANALSGAMAEAAEIGRGIRESLESAECALNFVLPAAAPPPAAGGGGGFWRAKPQGRPERRCRLTVAAVARISEVLEMVALELGAEGEVSALEFAGEKLPLEAAVHQLRLQDGDTVLVVRKGAQLAAPAAGGRGTSL